MKVNSYGHNIYEIENFLTQEEQNTLYTLLSSVKETDWLNSVTDDITGNRNTGWDDKLLYLSDSGFDGDMIVKRLKSFFIDFDNINSIINIQRYRPDESMSVHVDDYWDKVVKFGVVIYINDNYSGGEIYYPDLSLAIKPKARSLMIHPAGQPHGVKKVLGSSTRYIFSTFVHGHQANINHEVLNGLQ